MSSISKIFHVGVSILSTAIDSVTNTILAQIGSVTEEYTYSDGAEWYQHVGFSSRPSQATAGHSAAEGVGIKGGDRDIIVASRDTRSQQIYGNLKEGETCVWAGGIDGKAQGRLILKQDGSLNLFCTDTNVTAGNSVYFRVAPDGFFWVAPWGTLRFDASGFHLKTASGARLDLGGIGGLPPLPPGVPDLTSYATMQAAMVSTGGALNALNTGPDASPAARANPLVLYMADVAAAIAAITAALPAGPALAAAVAAAGTVTAATPGLAGQVSSGTMV